MDPTTTERALLTGYFIFCHALECWLSLNPFPPRWAWCEITARVIILAAVIVILVSNFELVIYRHIIWPVLFCAVPMLFVQLNKAVDDTRRANRKEQENQTLLNKVEKELENYG